jgi:hypothetical protein
VIRIFSLFSAFTLHSSVTPTLDMSNRFKPSQYSLGKSSLGQDASPGAWPG